MILIERPCCDTPLAIDLPLTDALCCDDCGTTWDVADATLSEVQLAA